MGGLKLSIWQYLLIAFFKVVNFFIAWHKLPSYLGTFNILAFRYELRAKNLYDTYPEEDYQGTTESDPMHDTKFLSVRNSDGAFNDLQRPRMGCSAMRFGRNVPRHFTKKPTEEELMTPNPRIISERILKRETFQPATIVNLLAAAWIQFQVHDWVQHTDSKINPHVIPLPEGDKWSDRKMKVERTEPDQPLSETDEKCPAYKNENTHWWDASQLYGSNEEGTRALRAKAEDGQLRLTTDGHGDSELLPQDVYGLPMTGFNQNWWLGLELLHTLFALEHNAICSQLKVANPNWTSDQLFDTARLINCALMAKIHTLEWTPAILPHPAVKIGMAANWWGLVGEDLSKVFGRISSSEVVSGVPGSDVELDNAPYCLTEEFVSVYRLHPLIPDDVAFFNVTTGAHQENLSIKEIAFEGARRPLKDGLSFADVLYSFGINYPGAITAHNTPNFLRDLHLPDGRHLDMGSVDILRDRERGVPRYCQFRRLFHMSAPSTFEQLTGGNKLLARELQDVYVDDIEAVDLLVGCLCEPLPKGFGFSDTAFRVFILMAARRLKSDRFIATEWKSEVYTQEGLAWIQSSSMKDVLCRHFPELRAPLRNVENAFAPWEKVGTSAAYLGKETNEMAKVMVNGEDGQMV